MAINNNPFRTQSQLDLKLRPDDIDENPLTWRNRARCRKADPEIFHPSQSDTVARDEAKRICAQCPVAQACLDWAMVNDTHHAIYAGYEPYERRRMAINAARRAARNSAKLTR